MIGRPSPKTRDNQPPSLPSPADSEATRLDEEDDPPPAPTPWIAKLFAVAVRLVEAIFD
jgi:hypothetical protein